LFGSGSPARFMRDSGRNRVGAAMSLKLLRLSVEAASLLWHTTSSVHAPHPAVGAASVLWSATFPHVDASTASTALVVPRRCATTVVVRPFLAASGTSWPARSLRTSPRPAARCTSAASMMAHFPGAPSLRTVSVLPCARAAFAPTEPCHVLALVIRNVDTLGVHVARCGREQLAAFSVWSLSETRPEGHEGCVDGTSAAALSGAPTETPPSARPGHSGAPLSIAGETVGAAESPSLGKRVHSTGRWGWKRGGETLVPGALE
jgi:hypothetical protein